MNHRIGRSMFALVVGLTVAVLSYQWITNPERGARRALEEQVVNASRELLRIRIGVAALEIVDPLSPNRKVGKVYIYAEKSGWAVSGFYRRDDADPWHPYLIQLTPDFELHAFKAEDPELDVT